MLLLIVDVREKLDQEKHVSHGILKFHMLIVILVKKLELLETTSVGIQTASVKQFGVIQQTQKHHGSYAIQLNYLYLQMLTTLHRK